jgi:hypothetical protein
VAFLATPGSQTGSIVSFRYFTAICSAVDSFVIAVTRDAST